MWKIIIEKENNNKEKEIMQMEYSNSPENIEEYIKIFKQILLWETFPLISINEIFSFEDN